MKTVRTLYTLAIFGALFIPGCKKGNVQPLFEIESVASFTIQAGLNTVETHHFLVKNLTSSFQAQLETRNLSLDDLSIIKPLSMVITSLDPDIEFSFISSVTTNMYMVDPDKGLEIYFREPVPINTKSTLELFPSLLNIKDIISQPLFNIDVMLRLRTFINRNIDVRLDMVFQVEA